MSPLLMSLSVCPPCVRCVCHMSPVRAVCMSHVSRACGVYVTCLPCVRCVCHMSPVCAVCMSHVLRVSHVCRPRATRDITAPTPRSDCSAPRGRCVPRVSPIRWRVLRCRTVPRGAPCPHCRPPTSPRSSAPSWCWRWPFGRGLDWHTLRARCTAEPQLGCI